MTEQTAAFNDVFQGGGEMGAQMRAYDWDSTPLGRPEAWPRSLQSIVRMMLTSRYQMWMAWGEALTFFCNDAYAPTLGLKRPWALGTPAPVVWAEIWSDIGPLIDEVLATGEATYSEGMLLFLQRSGFPEETYHTFSYSPLFDDAGKVAGMFCVVVEETERVISERRLGALRQLASAVSAIRTEGELVSAIKTELGRNQTDLPFTLTYLTDPEAGAVALAACTGVEAGDPIALPTLRLDDRVWPFRTALDRNAPVVVSDLGDLFTSLPTGAWDKPPANALMIPIAQQGVETAAGFLIVGLSPYRPLDAGYSDFLQLLSGQIAAALASARAYDAERRRAEALAEIDRAKTTFFSNVSHEFRTPLTLMLGPLEDVLAEALSPEIRAPVELAHRNGLRLLRLVNSLLDFSRIEAGRTQAEFRLTDLATYSAEIASSFRSAIERAGLELVIDARPLREPVYVDQEMWEKVLLNLLSNAFKFTFEGRITVSVGPSADGSCAEVKVSDTGIGVSAENLPRLFERFHRIEGAQGRNFEGSGIGLALVQELVRLHGGTIFADSVLGQGTSFTLRLPYGDGHLDPGQVRGEPTGSPRVYAQAMVEEALRWLPEGQVLPETGIGATGGTVATPQSGRILLADDNADMREYVQRLLQGQGYEVETAPDGEAALAAARARVPDLILSDVMMPRLDGFGLLRAIRSEPALAGVPVVLLSARAGEEAKVEGLEAGADDYLIKPFAARELLARVAVNIQMARLRRDAARAVMQSEQRALITQERLELALSSGRIAVFQFDPESGDATVLGPLTAFFGVAEQNAAGGLPLSRFIEGVASADRDRVLGLIRTAIANDTPFEAEYRIVGGDRARRVIARGGLQVGADGVKRLVGAVIDVTEEKAAQAAAEREIEQRRAAEAKLQALNAGLEERIAAELDHRMRAEEALRQAQKMEAVGQLTGGVAHDFNNLLTVIIGGLDTIRRNAPADNGRMTRALDMASQGANRAATLTARLLAFSRRQPLEPKPIDLNVVVRDSTELLHRTLGETIELEGVLASRLWPVEVDQNQLESAILNLAVNARDAMPEGGKLTIETANTMLDERYSATDSEVAPGQYAMISVSDSGQGMPRDVLDRAFEPFYTTKDVGKGTGLGLSMVYGFVKQSGGHITLYSEPGEGTTVKLYFPRFLGGLEPEGATSAGRAPEGMSDETVLVVEDNEEVRSYSVSILTELGYHVLEAADADQGLAIARGPERIDLLFTDVVLPGRSGRVLADEVRALRPEVKVLFTTGYSRNAIVHQGRLDAGVNLITKPFTFDQLAQRLRDVLDG